MTRVVRAELPEPPEVEADVPEDCPECARLFLQARAAVLTDDRPRRAEVELMQRQHRVRHDAEGSH